MSQALDPPHLIPRALAPPCVPTQGRGVAMKGGRDLKPAPGGADRPLVPAYAPCRPGRLQRHLLSGEFDQLRDFAIFESNFVQVWSPGPPPLCGTEPLLCELWPAPMTHRPVEPSPLASPILWLVCGFRSLCLRFIDCTRLWFLSFNPKISAAQVCVCGTVDADRSSTA